MTPDTLRPLEGDTVVYLPQHTVSPEQSARMLDHLEAVNEERLPGGWWIVPALVIGIASWLLIFGAAATLFFGG